MYFEPPLNNKDAALAKDPDDWRLNKNLRNTATAKKKTEKKAWGKRKLDSSEHNLSKF